MNLFRNLDLNTVWEAIKTPVRQGLLALYAFVLNKLFVYLATVVGFELTPDQQAQLLSYGVPFVWAIISAIDKLLHKVGKQTGSLRMTYGLTPYLEKINN